MLRGSKRSDHREVASSICDLEPVACILLLRRFILDHSLPTVDRFSRLARDKDIVAMGKTLVFDHETAISLVDRFLEQKTLFLLESATQGPGQVARYSYLGFDPLWTWKQTGLDVVLTKENQVRRLRLDPQDPKQCNPVQSLKQLFSSQRFQAIDGQEQARDSSILNHGGAVGFFSYDIIAHLENRVAQAKDKQLDLPESFFFLPKNLFVLDQLARRLTLIRYIDVSGMSPAELKASYVAETSAITKVLNTLNQPHHVPRLKIQAKKPDFDAMQQTFPKERFLQAVDTCMEHIKSGDIFQVQIGNRLSTETSARPLDIFRSLRSLNPSPYMFYYQFDGHHILGASPEMMVNVSGRTVVQRPIAGTRKRTWQTETDKKMVQELKDSEKEQAEHIMLVDLSRNDIGRIAAPGSVQVDELMSVEKYSHVFHLVSQVAGELAENEDAFSAMVASFPNGTVAGAPKIRAMEIIRSLEPVAREFYAGSLGMFDFAGDLKSTILIRSIHVSNGTASTQASAGIVYDSIPEHEWQETRNKMAACVSAIQSVSTD